MVCRVGVGSNLSVQVFRAGETPVQVHFTGVLLITPGRE